MKKAYIEPNSKVYNILFSESLLTPSLTTDEADPKKGALSKKRNEFGMEEDFSFSPFETNE